MSAAGWQTPLAPLGRMPLATLLHNAISANCPIDWTPVFTAIPEFRGLPEKALQVTGTRARNRFPFVDALQRCSSLWPTITWQ